jgi:hypothetical protein
MAIHLAPCPNLTGFQNLSGFYGDTHVFVMQFGFKTRLKIMF